MVRRGIFRPFERQACAPDIEPPAPRASNGLLALDVLLILLAAGWFCFYKLDHGSFDDDETIGALITQNIIETGELFDLRMGPRPYYGKPPLKMWLTALPVLAFGQSNFSFRFVDALFGAASCLLVYFIALRMFASRRAGLIAVASLLGCHVYILQHVVRASVQDSLLVFMFTLAMWLAWLIIARLSSLHGPWMRSVRMAQTECAEPSSFPAAAPGSCPWKLAACLGLIVGLSAFTKITAGYVVLVVLAVYALLVPERLQLVRRGWRLALLVIILALAVPGPYWYYRCREGREVCRGVLAARAAEQAVSDNALTSRRMQYLRQLFIAQTAAHPVLLVLAALYGSAAALRRKDRRYLYLLNWTVTPYLFFILLKGKSSWYTAPAFPGMSLLIGAAFDQAGRELFVLANHGGERRKQLCRTVCLGMWTLVLLLLGWNLRKVALKVIEDRPEINMNRAVRAMLAAAKEDSRTIVLRERSAAISFRELAYMNMLEQRLTTIADASALAAALGQNVPVFAILPMKTLPHVFEQRKPEGYLDLPLIDELWKLPPRAALVFNRLPSGAFLPLAAEIKLGVPDAPVLFGWSGLHPYAPGESIRWSHGSNSGLLIQAGPLHLQLGCDIVLHLARSPETAPFTVQPYINRRPLAPFHMSSRWTERYVLNVPPEALHRGANVLELEYRAPQVLTYGDRVLLSNRLEIILGGEGRDRSGS